ncbi:hypothetical protein M011DRAFT_395798 [Sporormia fimetaria CBS 119925]|uniref:Signal peptidase complex subunit 2 n=1 Tax=Sporormia fimetaria CBS 119925 TaxID=1340428 RepID=A0A6A6VIY2_9PLEO|nr:hypothetical protein M011DRAFT_395798 [Sporormia fimetaria CBS 119925]
MSSATTKIAVHSLADLKNTTDDALPNYLHSLKFRQLHTKTDIRLLLGYSAVLIAGVLFYFDWKFGWSVTKPYTLPAVVAYFLLNGCFTVWVFWVEKGLVYEGENGQGEKISIRSHTNKHDPTYHLIVTITPSPPSTSQKSTTLNISSPFTKWFTADGYFTAKPFQQFLASSVPLIGAADPNNDVEEIGRGSGQNQQGGGIQGFNVSGNNALEILEQLKRAGANVTVGGQPVGGGQAGRRRK